MECCLLHTSQPFFSPHRNYNQNFTAMETALRARKQRILKRLEQTIEAASSILCEINQELEALVESNEALERTAIIYDTWISKM